MTALERALDEVKAALELSDGWLSWFGRRRLDLRDLDDEVRVEVVAAHLYQHWYTSGSAVVTTPSSEVTGDLQSVYDEVTAGHTDWFDGWQTIGEKHRDNTVVITDGSIRLTARVDDVRPGVVGSQLLAPLARRRISPGFYLIPWASAPDRANLLRAYVSVTPSGGPLLLRSFIEFRAGVDAQAKVLNSTGDFHRLDSAVVYFDQKHLEAVIEWLTDPAASFATELRQLSPALTHPIRNGVALAAEPNGSGSFGSTVTTALAAAIIEGHIDAAVERLHSAGLEPNEPSRRLDASPYPARVPDTGVTPLPNPKRRPERSVDSESTAPTSIVGQIANLLVDEAIELDGEATWLANPPPLPIATDRRQLATTVGPDLYSGTAGIGLFLHRAANAIGDNRVRTAAEAAIAHTVGRLEAGWRAPGWYTGSAGAAITLVDLGPAVVGERAHKLAQSVLAEPPSVEWTNPDLLSGLAGTLLATVRAAQRSDDESYRHAGNRIVEQLLSLGTSVETKGWPGLEGVALTGLSHGAAGIAYALTTWADLGATGGSEKTLRNTIEQSLAWEDSHYNPKARNWADLRRMGGVDAPADDGPNYVDFWCHGAPGIVLARTRCGLATHHEIDLWSTVATGIENWGAASDPALCHGLTGLADIAEAVHGRSQPAVDNITGLLDSLGPVQSWRFAQPGSFRPSMMLGLAGIGDWLLRQTHPSPAHPELRSPLDP